MNRILAVGSVAALCAAIAGVAFSSRGLSSLSPPIELAGIRSTETVEGLRAKNFSSDGGNDVLGGKTVQFTNCRNKTYKYVVYGLDVAAAEVLFIDGKLMSIKAVASAIFDAKAQFAELEKKVGSVLKPSKFRSDSRMVTAGTDWDAGTGHVLSTWTGPMFDVTSGRMRDRIGFMLLTPPGVLFAHSVKP